MAGTMTGFGSKLPAFGDVSMESGLDGRNNQRERLKPPAPKAVSMESGLDGRNNPPTPPTAPTTPGSTSQWSPA